MEICINEYVRTKNGQIVKVINIKQYKYKSNIIFTDVLIDEHQDRDCNDNFLREEDVLNHSFNIIDLIQVRRYSTYNSTS